MCKLDQVLRTGIGAVCVYFGFIDTSFIDQPVLAAIVGIFGIMNLFAAFTGYCPVYRFADISGWPASAAHTQKNPEKMRVKLRTRLLISSVTIAMIVLVIFGTVAYYIALESASTREIVLIRGFAQDKAHAFSAWLAGDKSLANVRKLLANDTGSGNVTVVVDTAGHILSSRPLSKVLGKQNEGLWLAELVRNQSGGDFTTVDDKRHHWGAAAISGTPYKLILLTFHTVDDSKPAYQTLGVHLLITGGIVLWVAVWGGLILSGITSRRLDKQNAVLLHQALHDSLTDLPNRTLLRDRMQQAIYYSQRENKPIALFFIDLNGFKEINDTLGYKSGDTLLKQVGSRLQGVFWKRDTVARLGGDEFAILLPGVDVDQVVLCAQKVTDTLEKPFTINKLNIQTGASIGIALYPEHGKDPETLVRHAEVAMYQAKQNNREFVVYTPDADPHDIRRFTLMSELREAIERDELTLYYQPKINIATRTIIGVEALVRWQHPLYGVIPPNDFIPLAEQSGLIKPLTRWVIKEALRQCCAWRRGGINLSISVNVSMRSLRDRQLPDLVASLLERADAPPSCLNLEITESAVMVDPASSVATLRELRALGIRLSVDDFGTGFTSLSYLKELPIDEIKIDKSFVMGMTQNDNDAVIVRSIIELARNMGYSVVAEGIEDKDAWDMLEMLECTIGQGYYMARPLPAAKLERWLVESSWGFGKGRNVTFFSARARSRRG